MELSKIRNRVQPSPWTTMAPYGFSYAPKKLRFTPYLNNTILCDLINTNEKIIIPPAHRYHNILKESKFFKSLNKNTLLLSFLGLSPAHVEAALILCDNDLSEAITVLRLKNRLMSIRKAAIDHRDRKKHLIKYIPTKYNDVQIVENGNSSATNMKIMEVNNDILQMLKTCATSKIQQQATSDGCSNGQHNPNSSVETVNAISFDNRTKIYSGGSMSLPVTRMIPPATINGSLDNDCNNVGGPATLRTYRITPPSNVNKPFPSTHSSIVACKATNYIPPSTSESSTSSFGHSDMSEKLKGCPVVTQECVVLPNKVLERALTFCTPFPSDSS